MALRIRIEHGQDAGTTWRLATPGVYRFGRSPHTSVQVLDMKVSKEHFEIHVGMQSAALRDLGSTHGTQLNQQRVPPEPRLLNPGDEIRAGLTVLRVLSDGAYDQDAKPVGPLPAGEPAAAPPAAAPAAGASGAPAASASRAAGPSAAAPDPLAGTSLAGYRLLERVGAGGMGAVYRAEQLSLHREVALKVLSERLVSDSAFVDQFVNEARAAGQLNHPNVVQVYDVGQADGRHFFSMEFIHGGSLESKIPRTGGGVPWQDALNWFLDAANALIFAEKKGILHRDIKPDNFMLGQDGSVKLCDLGLAKKSESADLLAQGIIGTPHFIAPEAIRRKTEVDRRADLYSLGCSFFRIFTGRNPYPAPSVKDILLAHLNAPVPRVSSVVPGFPKDLDDVVFQLMQKDPAQRYASADDLWKALDRIRLQHGMEAHGLHPGRAKKLAIAGALVAVAAVGTLIYLEPWKDKTREIKTTETVYKPTGADPLLLRATQADSAFNTVRADMASQLGNIEQGDAWRKDAWEQFAKRFDGIAKEFDGTDAAGKAKAEAKRIRDYRTQAKARADALAAAIGKAAEALAEASSSGVAAARAATTPLEAEKAIETGLAKVREAAKAEHQGQALVTPEDLAKQEAPLDALRAELAGQVRSAFQTVDADAKKRVAAGTAKAFEEAAALYETFVEQHPQAPGAGAIAKAWNDARASAETAARTIRGRQAEARRRDLASDRQAYYAWLAHDAYAPRREDGTSGDYAAFRFSEVAEKAAKAAAAARTAEYRTLLEGRAAEARLAGRLPGLLAQGFAAKGFKDRLQGTGWNGVPKGFSPEGVLVADKTRLYADEGLGWFVDLFFDKGQERYPLDADAWEGLAVLAEAATIQEGASRGDLAAQAFQKAAELDPARKGRLEARIGQVRAEQRVRALLDESDELVAGTVRTMEEYAKAIADTDTKKSAAARKEVQDKEAEMRGRLEDARSKLLEAEAKHPSTVGRALLDDKPPPEAAYAGEPPPPPAAPAPVKAPSPPAMDGAK